MTKVRDLSKIVTKAYANKWVALSRDYKKVVASASRLADLSEKVGDKNVVYMKVPSAQITHVF